MKAAADASPGTPSITCNQNQRAHPGAALASAMVFRATGNETYRARAEALIEAAYPTARSCGNSILSLGRQLGAYVMAADYIGYRDPAFVSWLRDIRTKDLDGHTHWYTLDRTARTTSNNWGTFALASKIAADLYLGDQAEIAEDWAIFKGYGDGSWAFRFYPDGGTTGDYEAMWTCTDYESIEQEHCGSPDRNGAPVEDASRSHSSTPDDGYVNEAVQGYTVQALLLERAGFDAFGVNDAQVCRVADFQQRFGIQNGHSTGYYAAWVFRSKCSGSNYPLPTSAPFGRVFGFTNWLDLG